MNLLNKKSLTFSALSVALMLGVASCADESLETAQGQFNTAETTESATTSTSAKKTTESAKPTPSKTPQKEPECTVASVQENPEYDWVDTIMECEGGHMYAGKKQTDWTGLFYFADGHWQQVEEDGRISTGFKCYNSSTLEQLGFPEAIMDKAIPCDEGQSSNNNARYISSVPVGGRTVTASTPQCDGRNILIVDSAYLPGNPSGELEDRIGRALAQDSSLEFTTPGICSSLRGEVNGQDVYPIYYDFGSDRQAVCEAKAVHGGNARTLNNDGNFFDPC